VCLKSQQEKVHGPFRDKSLDVALAALAAFLATPIQILNLNRKLYLPH
jgi:hypothetical protein